MRAMFAVALALSMAMAGLFMVGSGFNMAVGHEERAPTISEELDSKANGSSVSFDSSARSEDDGSIAGFIISGVTDVVNLVIMVALMPLTLRDLGFPKWFADSVGYGFYVLLSVAVAQFASGRIFR